MKQKNSPDTEQSPEPGVDYLTLYNYWRRISETKHPEKGIPLLRQLLTQKRTVTMMWVWELKDLFIGYEAGNPISLVLNKLKEQGIEVEEEEEEEEREQEPMDKETAADMEFHRLKDEGRLDRFGRRKDGT